MGSYDWVKRINYLGDAVDGIDYLAEINPDQLISQAMKSTGLENFGDDEWRTSYAELIKDLNSKKNAYLLGRLINKASLLIALRNRLLLVETLSRQPLVINETINGPLIVTGLPRTGTTILYELLCQDHINRSPKGYEAYFPTQSAAIDDIKNSDARIISECMFELTMDIEPEIKVTHDNRADLPAECWMIISNVLGNPRPTFYDKRDYNSRLSGINSQYNYAWHEKVLKLLQFQKPTIRWLLKCPSHMYFMKDLFERYPKAKVIHMHRNPVSSIPSLLNHLKCFDNLDQKYNPKKNHRSVLALMEESLRINISERKNGILPENQIADIYFDDLMHNPTDTIAKAYEKLNLEWSSKFEEGILNYLSNRPREKHGKHIYTASDFSLCNEEIREQFSFYTDHYNIDTENY